MVEGAMATFRFRWLGWVMLAPVLACAQPGARVIVKLKADSALLSESSVNARSQSVSPLASTGLARMQRLGSQAGVPLSNGRAIGPRMHVAQALGMSSEALAAHLARQADVEYAVVDEVRQRSIVPNDPLYAESSNPPNPPNVRAGQWYLRPPTGAVRAAINAEAAWDASYAAIGSVGASSVVVAVLDSGVRLDHADFVGKFAGTGFNLIADPIRSGGVERIADAEDRGDWLTQDEITSNPISYPAAYKCSVDATSSWHGMEVSGIIGAESQNAVGMASVGGLTKILPVRVLGKCGGLDSDIIQGMRWAAGLAVDGISGATTPRARVINLSLGSATKACSAAYRDTIAAVINAGVVIVAAAGNESKAVDSPANCEGVIAVAALRHEGTKVGFSSVGPEVAISAPGGNCVNPDGEECLYPIISASNSGASSPVSAASGGSTYSAALGTSFATPMVSGTVALMLAVRPNLTPAAVKAVLKNSARPFPTSGVSSASAACHAPTDAEQLECYCTSTTCGAGMLDAGAAVAQASGVIPVITQSPTAAVAGQAITFGSSGSMPSQTASNISSYQWVFVDGGGIVSALPSGGSSSSTLVVTPSAAGQFVISLTLTDDHNQTATTLQTVVVSAAPVQRSGGGGALDGGSLLFGAALLLRSLRRNRQL